MIALTHALYEQRQSDDMMMSITVKGGYVVFCSRRGGHPRKSLI